MSIFRQSRQDLRIYIAGASKEPERVRHAMQRAADLGYEITYDWLTAVEVEGAANEGLADVKRKHYARADLDAIRAANVVWLLAPEGGSTGAWVELGFALALGRIVFVSGRSRQRCIFTSLALFEFDDDAEAIMALRSYTRPL